MDNGAFIDQSSISGIESGHNTMQVLYQEILSAHESKPRASEMNLGKSTANLPGTTVPIFNLSCLTTNETKHPTKVLDKISSQSDLHCVSALTEAGVDHIH